MKPVVLARRAAVAVTLALVSFGVPSVALAGEPPAAHDPALRLDCPGGQRTLQTYTNEYGSTKDLRRFVLDTLPYADPYTQLHMRGRLDVRETLGAPSATVVVRGERREPIATYRFLPGPRGWELRSSAECRAKDQTAQPVRDHHKIQCPGYGQSGIIDGGVAPDAMIAPEDFDHTPPADLVRRYLAFAADGYTARHGIEPFQTTYRFEDTIAEVLVRDAHGAAIGTYNFDMTRAGWQMRYLTECSTIGPDGRGY